MSDFQIRNLTKDHVSFSLSFHRGLSRARFSRVVASEPVRLRPSEVFSFGDRLGLDPVRARDICETSPELLRLVARGHVAFGPWPPFKAPEVPAKPSAALPILPERPKLRGEPVLLHLKALEEGQEPAPLPIAGHGNNATAALEPEYYAAPELDIADVVEAPLDIEEEDLGPSTTARGPNDRPDATWRLDEIVQWADANHYPLTAVEKRTKQKALRAIAEADK